MVLIRSTRESRLESVSYTHLDVYKRQVHIPGERTVYRVMAEIGLNHKPKRKPNAITKADSKPDPRPVPAAPSLRK